MTNREFSVTNIEFLNACKKVALKHIKNYKATVRQASKWRRQKGIAWKMAKQPD